MGARYGQKGPPSYTTVKRMRLAIAALNLPDGTVKPYRPVPRDFRETYIRMGWDGIEDHYCTNTRVIRRWIEEEGRDGLAAARAAYVEGQREERRTRRMTAVKPVRAKG